MSYASITIEINGVEIDAFVEYEFTPEVPAKLYGLPENCHEGEPEEFELNKLTVFGGELDLTEMLSVDEIKETIIESIKESWGD